MAIYDCAGAQISTGDFCEISGAYFKTDNGLYLVTASEGDPITTGRGLTLHKCGKSGKLRTSGGTVDFWPLSSYCSDPRKNAAARAHNKENAQIKRVSLPMWYAAEHFRNEAQKAAERVERYTNNGWSERDIEQAAESRDFYTAIADRLSENAENPKEKAPETGIKFYYNGIKVDGGKLIPCYMSIDGETVHINVKDYSGILPTQYFTVIDESDSMTDYFEKERTTLNPSHPLYKFARYAALKCLMNGRTYRKPTPEQIKEWNTTKDPGQPTADDLAAVAEMKTEQESARLAAEHAAELAEREKVLNERNAGRAYIESVSQDHPLTDGAPYVVIEWSEHPAFYSWEDGQLVLSVAAAEIILKHYDEERHDENVREGKVGYFKTKFTIHYTENGAEVTHCDRYDLGDNYGGLIEMIRSIPSEANHRFADMLEEHTDGGRAVSVTVPFLLKKYAWKRKKEQERQKEKQNEEEEKAVNDLMDTVQMLTDEQIEAAVMAIDPNDKNTLGVARFFLQELTRRDEKNALEVFIRWKAGS